MFVSGLPRKYSSEKRRYTRAWSVGLSVAAVSQMHPPTTRFQPGDDRPKETRSDLVRGQASVRGQDVLQVGCA